MSTKARTCSVPGCDRPHSARGLCKGHLDRTYYAKNQGDPGEATFERQWPKWTPKEDAELNKLIDERWPGVAAKGRVEELALHLGRTPGATRTRVCFLRQKRKESK